MAIRFIIDGVITLPIALYGFLVFPDVPATTKVSYLTEEVRLILRVQPISAAYSIYQQRVLAYDRLRDGHDVGRHPLSWDLAKKVLTRWRWYGCSLLVSICRNLVQIVDCSLQFAVSGQTESFSSNNLMGQWLSATQQYSVEQVGT